MKRSMAALFGILTVFTPELIAKEKTIRIVIQGGDLKKPIQLTNPDIVASFNVWSGPANENVSLVVDWSKGEAVPPMGGQFYDVSIVTERPSRGTYRVSYVIDASRQHGYVFLPGRHDPRWLDNVWLIYRGVEGRWFHAWTAWEKLANPLITSAMKDH